jgi:hypothetical protein
MKLDARTFVRGGAEISLATGGTTLRIAGSLREKDVGAWFEPLIQQIHAAATEHAVPEVVLDLRDLEYANAALWSCLVDWLRLIRREMRQTYKLRLRSGPHGWQRIGVPTLIVFGVDRLIVE